MAKEKSRINEKIKKQPSEADEVLNVNLARRKKLIVIIAAITLAAIIGLVVTGLILYINKEEERFNYLTEDLSQYIYISPENYTGYKGYEVTIAIDEITDDTVATALMQARVGERGGALNSAAGQKNAVIEAGDDVLLYFQGYYVNDDGSKGSAISGLGNFTVEKEADRTYTVGGGSLDKLGLNLELKMLGKDLSAYTACDVADAGAIKDDDIVFVTYTAKVLKDGQWSDRGAKTERMNLSDADVDSVMGVGFKEKILGLEIGKELKQWTTSTDEYSQIYYSSIKVDYALRLSDEGQEPLRIQTTVPCSYSTVSLKGVPVIFEMYIDYAVKYSVPELNDEFIRDTLEVSDKELEKYEGANNVERFAAYTRDLLKKRDEAEIDSILIEAMWSWYYQIAEFKALPEDEVQRLVNKQREIIVDAYNKDSKDYESLDAYANAYVQYLGSELVWTDYLRSQAESEVKQKLIFYYVARAENLLPSEAEFDALAKKIKEEDIEYTAYANGVVRKNFATEAEYQAAIATYRAEVEAYYADEEVLRWTVDIEYAEAKMSKFAKVVYKGAQSVNPLD